MAAARVQEAPEAMAASGQGCSSPEGVTIGVTAPWEGRALQTLPAMFWGFLQIPGRAWSLEEQTEGHVLHIICFGQSQGQDEGVFSRQEFSPGLTLLPL